MKNIGSGNFNAGISGDRSLRMGLADTFRLAWADPELRQRLTFVLSVFAVFALAVHVPVPLPGVSAEAIAEAVRNNTFLTMMNSFGGRALQKVSIVALGLAPYITASIVMQVLQAANPAMKQEMREGGEYARRKNNQRIRVLTIILCIGQGVGLLRLLTGSAAINLSIFSQVSVILFWTAGAMFMLWLGEQITERGIGNGVSMLIFAGIVIAFPDLAGIIFQAIQNGTANYLQLIGVIAIFLLTTVFIVYFTIAQRRLPIQHMRRQLGTKQMGGATSYLPLPVNLVGVMPIIFALSLTTIPAMLTPLMPEGPVRGAFDQLSIFLNPNLAQWQGWVGALLYMGLIFFFTYFWTAIQFNVDDISDNLRRSGSFIPGTRPGKQTRDFLDAVITRISVAGALFLSVVAVSQFFVPLIMPIQALTLLFGTSLLIMVSVALETMRQIEANLMMKQYGN